MVQVEIYKGDPKDVTLPDHHCPKGHAFKTTCITKGHVAVCDEHKRTMNVYTGERGACAACVQREELALQRERKLKEKAAKQAQQEKDDEFFKQQPGRKKAKGQKVAQKANTETGEKGSGKGA